MRLTEADLAEVCSACGKRRGEHLYDGDVCPGSTTFTPTSKYVDEPNLRQLDYLQGRVYNEALRRWPSMTVETEGLALAEEAGEVCRAILKRSEGTRGTREGWTANLRTELAQTVFVLLNIASMEGVLMSTIAEAAMEKLLAMPLVDPDGRTYGQVPQGTQTTPGGVDGG